MILQMCSWLEGNRKSIALEEGRTWEKKRGREPRDWLG